MLRRLACLNGARANRETQVRLQKGRQRSKGSKKFREFSSDRQVRSFRRRSFGILSDVLLLLAADRFSRAFVCAGAILCIPFDNRRSRRQKSARDNGGRQIAGGERRDVRVPGGDCAVDESHHQHVLLEQGDLSARADIELERCEFDPGGGGPPLFESVVWKQQNLIPVRFLPTE